MIRAGGTLVTIARPTDARPAGGLTIDFVVVPDSAQLSEPVQRVRDGRLRTNFGKVAGATPMQVALAWLLLRSPNILLIPGTS